MKYYTDADLSAKVKAVNACHARLNEAAPQFVASIGEFLNCKVLNADGKQSKKFAVKADAANLWTSELKTFVHVSHLTLWIEASANFSNGVSSIYHIDSVYCGDIRDGILSSIANNFKPLRTDYTEEEIRSLLKAVDEADNKLSEAKRALGPFA